MVRQYTQYDRLPEYLFEGALWAIEAGGRAAGRASLKRPAMGPIFAVLR
jgi:hypothetical protein